MRCQRCNAELKLGAKFCGKCGAPVSQESEKPFVENGAAQKKAVNAKMILIVVMGVVILALVLVVLILLLKKPKNEETAATQSETYVNEMAESDEPVDDDSNPVQDEEAAAEAPQDEEWTAPQVQEDLVADGATETPLEYYNPDEHKYELIVSDVTWSEAESLCEEKGGHLASIICYEERDKIEEYLREISADQMNVPYQIWLGAYAENGGFTWVTGEGPGFSNWNSGEPSGVDPNTGVEENYLDMYYSSDTGNWVWQDVPEDISEYWSGHIAYLCEWERKLQ